MTWTVYFSGVHGGGKTTIRTKVTQTLQKAGLSVYAFPEFSYIPDIPIGTPEFQLWYRIQLRIRQELIHFLTIKKYFDVILVDRHPVDEMIYAKRLGGNQKIEFDIKPNTIHIIVDRPIKHIIDSVVERMEHEDELHRKRWNEGDIEYLTTVKGDFMKLYEDNKKSPYMNLITNMDLSLSIKESLKIIMRCID